MRKVLVSLICLTTFKSLQLALDNIQVPQQLISTKQEERSKPDFLNFSNSSLDEDGNLCIFKEDIVESIAKAPLLECKHRAIEKCHMTYLTIFTPSQEEECDEMFEKTCQITFRKEASTESVRNCFTPLVKVCNGQGPEKCEIVWESSCTTVYVEDRRGKFIADSKCVKIPKTLCGQGCVVEEGLEECHEKKVDILMDVPEELCDLHPHKFCRHVTKLTPSLKPTEKCTSIPAEVCALGFMPKPIKKTLLTKWCRHIEENSVDSENAVETDIKDTRNKVNAPKDWDIVREADLQSSFEKLRRYKYILAQ